MEGNRSSKQANALENPSSSSLVPSKQLSTEVEGRFGRSQVQDSQNQQHLASSHGLPEQGVLFSKANIVKFTTSSRSRETKEVVAAESTGIAEDNGTFVTGALDSCRSEPTQPEGEAESLNAAGCTRRSESLNAAIWFP
ncbi:hypothetical protein AXF42_Ash021819 [Apostasia shenzhenica]|uniref:Uncharacterized protein n=1 Tax=Apostasia shenzhenica TaxID=1088818 RepID=A0A2H9ZUB5_9ASPA|nr:hypothetical protein AXF42_Ash021819 [Apostasia shenzhenica]